MGLVEWDHRYSEWVRIAAKGETMRKLIAAEFMTIDASYRTRKMKVIGLSMAGDFRRMRTR